MTNGLPADPLVAGIVIHPNDPEVICTGTQDRPYRSANRGNSWERLDYPKTGVRHEPSCSGPETRASCTWAPLSGRSTVAPTAALPLLRNTIPRAAWRPMPLHNGAVLGRCGSCRCRTRRPITQSDRGQQRLHLPRTPHECAAFRLRWRGEVRLRFGQDPVTSSSDHCSGILAGLVGQILGC